MVTSLCSPKKSGALDSITSQLKCVALGLNRHFPRAILHGPMMLGGLGIPSSTQKYAKERLNYFLFNICCKSTIQQKLDMSIIYTQLEVVSFQQFFSIPFSEFGHLASRSFCVQVWRELEPDGIILRPFTSSTWIPTPLSQQDKAVMDIATKCYNTKGSSMINWCRQFLNISVIDLLIPRTKNIHPSFICSEKPPSRISTILWPPFPRPPKRYWTLWSHFIRFHVTPCPKIHEHPVDVNTSIPFQSYVL